MKANAKDTYLDVEKERRKTTIFFKFGAKRFCIKELYNILSMLSVLRLLNHHPFFSK